MAEERDWRAGAILGVGLLLCAVLLMYLGRHLSFFADEWTFALNRRAWTVDSLLTPHNGHLVLVPALIYKVFFEIVGFAHSWPYRLTLILFHAACVACIYLIARRRFGPWIALFPAGLLLLPGTSSDQLLSAFQIAFVGSMAFGLGALLCLDREERRFDIAATVLVALSISCSTIGMAFAVGILVELILTVKKRQRLYVVLIPFALYALWYVGFSSTSGENQLKPSNLHAVPRYDARVLAQGFSGFGNLPILLGSVLMAITVGWLGIKLLANRGLPARAFVGIVGGLVFWTLAALARAEINDAAATRYIEPTMIFILIAVIACLPPIHRVAWWVAALMGAFVIFAVANDIAPLNSFIDYRAREDAFVHAEISAEALAAREGDPWLSAVEDLDYKTLTARQILALPPEQGLRADQNQVALDMVAYGAATPPELQLAHAAPVDAGPSVRVGRVTAGGATCTKLTPKDGRTSVEVALPVTRDLLIVRAGQGAPALRVNMRRYASEFQPVPVPIPAGQPPAPGAAGVVRIIDDASSLAWYARVAFSAPLGLCLVPPLS